jgi:FAD/FMN-containing dehydrogenase
MARCSTWSKRSTATSLLIGATIVVSDQLPAAAFGPGPAPGNMTSCIASCLTGLKGEYTFNRTSGTYQNATDIDNRRCRVLPFVVVWPLDDADVQLSLTTAQQCGLPFSVVSGGHGAAGFELAQNGLTVSMARMAAVSVNPTTGVALVQPGARFKSIYESTPGGWVPVGGGCPMVAPGGYYLGGGWSFLSRSYGLAIDSLLSVTTVLANSTIVTANATDACSGGCADLWWASRGGGGGNFGVATRFSVQLQKAVPQILIGQLCWSEDVADLGAIWGWLMDLFVSIRALGSVLCVLVSLLVSCLLYFLDGVL